MARLPLPHLRHHQAPRDLHGAIRNRLERDHARDRQDRSLRQRRRRFGNGKHQRPLHRHRL